MLEQEHVSADCFVAFDAVQEVGRSAVTATGQRAAAVRFGDPRALAVLAALADWAMVPAGLTNKTLRPRVAAMLDRADYSSAQMSYDLRRLRLKGLVARQPRTHTYRLTPVGAKLAVFYTKVSGRVLGGHGAHPVAALPLGYCPDDRRSAH